MNWNNIDWDINEDILEVNLPRKWTAPAPSDHPSTGAPYDIFVTGGNIPLRGSVVPTSYPYDYSSYLTHLYSSTVSTGH